MTTTETPEAIADRYIRRRLAELAIAELEATQPAGERFRVLADVVRAITDPDRPAAGLIAEWRAVASEPFRKRGERIDLEALWILTGRADAEDRAHAR